MLSDDLIQRLSARAADPEARTDAADPEALLAHTNVIELETAFGAVPAACGLKDGMQPEPAPRPLAPPVTAPDLDEAEQRLGFPLPDALRRVYGSVANGGFGPGSGLLPVREMVEYYSELRTSPPGEGGQPWPAHLLPFNRHDLCCDCYDTKTGKIVFWDEEMLLDGPGDAVWQRSFRAAAETLAAYFEAWLAAPPQASDRRYVNAADAGFPGSDVIIDMWTVKDLRNSIDILRQSPENLSKWGLPEQGWEAELCKARGLDPDIYLKLVSQLPGEEG